MIDEFMELTRRILKLLSVEYVEICESDDNNVTYTIRYGKSVPFLETKVEIYSQWSNYNQDAIMIVGDTSDTTNGVTYKTPVNESSPYMNTIYNIFNITDGKYGQHPWGLLYIHIYLNDINNRMLDEYLTYSDEELRLYISLL